MRAPEGEQAYAGITHTSSALKRQPRPGGWRFALVPMMHESSSWAPVWQWGLVVGDVADHSLRAYRARPEHRPASPPPPQIEGLAVAGRLVSPVLP